MSENDKDNIYVLQKELNKVLSSISDKSVKMLEKFKDGVVPLPDFDNLKKMALFYKLYQDYMDSADKLVGLSVELDLVITQMDEIVDTKLNRDLSNDYNELQNFKKYLTKSTERLKTYRYDLAELKKNVSDKIKLLQGLLYRWNSGV